MTHTKAHALAALGQSIWYDNIQRAFLESGELKALVDAGVLGVTSNPTIFERAITGSSDYDSQIEALVKDGRSVDEIYEALTVADIRQAADILHPAYEATDGVDGYISLEVSPTLAHDTQGTVTAARHLFAQVGRPNVMIKVPATPEGVPAIETLIGDGININVTLIFALDAYRNVMEAYLNGLEKLAAKPDADLKRVASVASFFVSRVDSLIDAELKKHGNTALPGKAAIANAKLAYALFRETFQGERWERLAARGARVQRPLWASTSTKNPDYPDTIYVDTLIGPDTVNTVPPQTLVALQDHATPAVTINDGLQEATALLVELEAFGIRMPEVTDKLLADGVAAFAKSFVSLMDSITEKRARMLAALQGRSAALGQHLSTVNAALRTMEEKDVMPRIWVRDHTVWNPEPAEIANRLGWLTIAERMAEPENLVKMGAFVDEVRADGLTQALLLGMGGSSLAPEVFHKTFGVDPGALDLGVLDSTDADAVNAYAEQFDLTKTLYIVSTKSGGTVETFSFFKYFYNRLLARYGGDRARTGRHFVAITDPGSGLETAARDAQFREIWLNDPEIGGRYSALSYFGLVPAALVGVDVAKLLERAAQAAKASSAAVDATDNPAAWLGAILGELTRAGRDKVTIVTSPAIASFGDWVEQLIAESTGKQGKGILPVVGEPLGAPEVYKADRLFVSLQLKGDTAHDAALTALEQSGHPVVRLTLEDVYDLGGQYFLWELAVAVAGYVIEINPFDQPNVESAKVLARSLVASYAQTGKLPEQAAAFSQDGIAVYGDTKASTLGEALSALLATPGAGYISLQAYVQPTPEADSALAALRLKLREQSHLATTVGYGPRFLHSTGQLHKGDAGHGLFIQFTSDPAHEVAIPDEIGGTASAMTFNVLKLAQAMGDGQALANNGRPVLRFHLGGDVAGGLQKILNSVN